MSKISITIALLCLCHMVIVQSSPLSSSCNCGLGIGSNVCRGRSCQPQVVRPQPLPFIDHPRPRVICKTIGGVEPLKPIGDLCSCGQTIVKPAIIPKPYCSGCGGIRNLKSNVGLFGNSQFNQNGQLGINLNQGESILGNDGESGSQYVNDNGDVSSGRSNGQNLNDNGGSYLNVNGGSYFNENGGSYLNSNGGSYINGNGGGGSYLNENSGSYLNENGGSYLNVNSGSYLNGNEGPYLGGNGDNYQVGQTENLGQLTINNQDYINQNDGISEVTNLDELVGNVQTDIQEDSFNPSSQCLNGPRSYVPADPVSQSLALQRSDVKNYVSDSKLQFGFHKLPRNVARSTIKTSFHEGNIQRLNGPVLELKVVPDAVSVDEEAIEDLLEDELEIEAPTQVRRISLGELGYGLEKGSSTKFINLDAEEREEKSCASEPHLYRCNDGFRGGRVVINEAPVPAQAYVSNKRIIPCAADEEQHSYGRDNLSFLQGSSYNYGSSSSNSNSAQSNVFLQKLGA